MIRHFPYRKLHRLGTFLLYGGSARIRRYEESVLARVQEELSAVEGRRALASQLESIDHLKRLHQNRMVTFYFYNKDHLKRLGNVAPNHRLMTFRLSIDSIKMTVVVMTHLGLLSSLEFSKDPGVLRSAEFRIEGTQDFSNSLVPEIDIAEHRGKEVKGGGSPFLT